MNDMSHTPITSEPRLSVSALTSEPHARPHAGNLLGERMAELEAEISNRGRGALPGPSASAPQHERLLFAIADQVATEFERKGDQAVTYAEDYRHRAYEAARLFREIGKQQDEKRAQFADMLDEALTKMKSVSGDFAAFAQAAE